MNLLSSVVCRDLRLGLVDPHLGWKRRRHGTTVREAFWMRGECGVEDASTTRERLGGETAVHFVRRAERERAVAMLVVVPIEESAGGTACVLLAAEALGKTGARLERLEGGLRK